MKHYLLYYAIDQNQRNFSLIIISFIGNRTSGKKVRRFECIVRFVWK